MNYNVSPKYFNICGKYNTDIIELYGSIKNISKYHYYLYKDYHYGLFSHKK